jgi:membrane-associated protein
MDFLAQLVDLVLHVDKHLVQLTDTYGVLMYAILFAIVFLETGVVVTPFLPGDSLLFAAGAIAAVPGSALNVHLLFLLLWVAAVAGDSLNYAIGDRLGPRVFREEWRFLSRKHLLRTQAFYEKHGGKTIFLARFVPIVRTFAPFVAGIGTMPYRRFLMFNVGGGLVWVSLFLYAGYFFGRLPVVRDNFSLVILVIIVLSVVPIGVEILRARLRASREARET